MFEAKQLQKHALECLRLQADCMQMAGVAPSLNLQSHFVYMAQFWGALAASGSSANADPAIFQSRDADTMTGRSPHVVLIVEHDELLQSLTADIMADSGFVALQASDADEALAILESRSDIALMLTSVTMPGSIDGLGLTRTVCRRWPAIKTIIASSQVRLIGSDLTAGSRFFLKPYHLPTMISEIRSLIGP
jgi:CheY-like chemotaxis protein